MNLTRWCAVVAMTLACGVPCGAQGGAALRGIVKSQADSAPIPGADVWLVSTDRHERSDSAGAFLFADLGPGKQLVEVRRIGYLARRDTVVLSAGQETLRQYRLAPQVPTLDTVHTVAGQQKYLSPALRGFEQRRLSGQGGYFISDSVLRANESSTLTNIIAGRFPGLMRKLGTLVSTRKLCQGPVLLASKPCAQGGNPNCYVAVFINGTLLFRSQMKVEAPDLSKMSVTEFSGIEFYPGASSAPAGMHFDDDGCGSLYLWTREK